MKKAKEHCPLAFFKIPHVPTIPDYTLERSHPGHTPERSQKSQSYPRAISSPILIPSDLSFPSCAPRGPQPPLIPREIPPPPIAFQAPCAIPSAQCFSSPRDLKSPISDERAPLSPLIPRFPTFPPKCCKRHALFPLRYAPCPPANCPMPLARRDPHPPS